MATSYANPGGTGDRQLSIAVATVGMNAPDVGYHLVNGSMSAAGIYFNVTTGCIFEFFFNAKKIIDEVKYYQSNTSNQGTWKWQGSNNRSSWTDIGGTFALGGATSQTITTLAGNVTAYQFYRMVQTAGTTNNGPYIVEFEFKIDEPTGTASYGHALGSGNRVATITVASSGITYSGSTSTALVNGRVALSGECWWNAAANAGNWVSFDLGTSMLMTQLRVWFDATVNHGDWKWQGSPDNSAWTDLTAQFTLAVTNPDPCVQMFASNTTGYRYYRLLGMAGSRVASGYVREFEFMLETPAAPTGGVVTQLMVETLTYIGPVPSRVTQLAVETLVSSAAPLTHGRVTQLAVETLSSLAPPVTGARMTQVAVETLTLVAAALATEPRVTQVVVETLTSNGFYPQFGLDGNKAEGWRIQKV